MGRFFNVWAFFIGVCAISFLGAFVMAIYWLVAVP